MSCSGLTLHTADGRHLLARTLDFDENPGAKLMAIPRNFRLSPFPQPSRYAQLAMGVMMGDMPMTLDGVNERGLAGAIFYYPGFASYEGPADGKTPLDPSFAMKCALALCRDLDEAEQFFRDGTALTTGTPEGSAPPLHFLFMDSSGEAMVIEPDAGGLSIYRNTIGVFANSPGYPWHETNLRNYLGVNREPKPPLALDGRELPQISTNAALWGLPGDYTSVSRFVKTAYLKRFIKQPLDEQDGVAAAFHVLSAVNVPRFGVGTDEAEAGYTMYTAVMSPSSGTYYFHTYDNRRVQAASLERENLDAAEMKQYKWSNVQDIEWRN
jgi:choloylglycine hydrolase